MKLCEAQDVPASGRSFFREPEGLKPQAGSGYPRVLQEKTSACPWVRRCSPGEPACPRSGKTPAVPAGRDPAEPARPVYKEGLQTELLDMRDHKLAERSALRLAALVHDYSDAVIIRDFRDRIIAWNRGAQRMYGYTEGEALGMNVSRLIPKKMPVHARDLARLRLHGRKETPIVTRRRTKDGRVLDVELTFKVLCDEKGAPIELATTERDITQQTRADRELRRLHARVISVQETERKRLARELHDGVGQILSGVKFRLESLPGKISLKGRAEAKILELGGFLDHAISEIRRVSKNLIPSELEDLGLEPAFRTLCREFNGRGGPQVTLRIGRVPEHVAPEPALALYRIAQEALNNIGKHSRATLAAVNLSMKGGELALCVSDNGIGLALGGERAPGGRGIGLGSMRERAESVGGMIRFRSKPGAGTKLGVRVPLAGLGGGAA